MATRSPRTIGYIIVIAHGLGLPPELITVLSGSESKQRSCGTILSEFPKTRCRRYNIYGSLDGGEGFSKCWYLANDYYCRYELRTLHGSWLFTSLSLTAVPPILAIVYSQNIVFDTVPVNQTVVQGGDATFSCSGTVDGTAQPTRYRIRSGATILQSVGGNISDLVAVSGIDAALVFGDFNSQLLLRGIRREANSYTVSCAILVGAVFREAMNTPLTFIAVICKSLSVHSVLGHSGLV